METKNLILTLADRNAVMLDDSNYINNKGAGLYASGTYALSVEYYRLAAAMGNVQAISNLGYCYLYGREIEANLSLAMAYFETAAKRKSVDAAYKLGDIYGSDKWGVQDKEMSVYYYRMAASFVIGTEWESGASVSWSTELRLYPSLCYALGRELSGDGYMHTDLAQSYQFLKHAEYGYREALGNGDVMYQKAYEGVLTLLADDRFSGIREKYDKYFEDGEDEEDEEEMFM